MNSIIETATIDKAIYEKGVKFDLSDIKLDNYNLNSKNKNTALESGLDVDRAWGTSAVTSIEEWSTEIYPEGNYLLTNRKGMNIVNRITGKNIVEKIGQYEGLEENVYIIEDYTGIELEVSEAYVEYNELAYENVSEENFEEEQTALDDENITTTIDKGAEEDESEIKTEEDEEVKIRLKVKKTRLKFKFLKNFKENKFYTGEEVDKILNKFFEETDTVKKWMVAVGCIRFDLSTGLYRVSRIAA